jgi:hypothetical protein
MDNTEDEITLIVEGLNLRGRRVPLHTQNPRNPQRFRPDTIRIKVKNIPPVYHSMTLLIALPTHPITCALIHEVSWL